jgi:hypothetical protein
MACAAAVFCAGQMQFVAQHVHQVGLRINADLVLIAVHCQRKGLFFIHGGIPRGEKLTDNLAA